MEDNSITSLKKRKETKKRFQASHGDRGTPGAASSKAAGVFTTFMLGMVHCIAAPWMLSKVAVTCPLIINGGDESLTEGYGYKNARGASWLAACLKNGSVSRS
jgi:hypothetical protein